MSRKMFFVIVCLATVINLGILIANLSSPSAAGIAGMDQQALLKDPDFVQAVQSIVQSCHVNADLEAIKC